MRLSSTRLGILYVALFGAGIVLVLGAAYALTVKVLDHELITVVETELQELDDDYAESGVQGIIDTLHANADSWGRTGAVYLLIDASGQRLAGNIADWPVDRDIGDQWFDFEIDALESGETVRHPVRARSYVLPGGEMLLVGTDILERQRLLLRLRGAMAGGIGMCVFLAAIIGFAYRSRVQRRVIAIADTCQSIMRGDLAQRLGVDGSHDEFDRLAGAVNLMLERIDEQTNVLRTTFDSAAHDLRAPLHRARVRIEETLQHEDVAARARGTMEATVAELERVERVLGTLLQIARTQGAGLPATEAVDVAALAHEIVELYQPQAATCDLSVGCTAPSPALVHGNRQLLAQALVNLLENAVKYTPHGGRIEVRVKADPQGMVELEVADSGPGIPVAERENVLRPFVRLARDQPAEGTGLGLSLVAAVMRMHGARLQLLDNDPGLLVRCTLDARFGRAPASSSGRPGAGLATSSWPPGTP